MRLWGLPVGLVAAACLTACGSSGSTTPPGGNASFYRSAANAACQTDRDALVALAAQSRQQHLTASELISMVEAIDTHFMSTISNLAPPAKLAKGHQKLLQDILSQGGQPVTGKGPVAAARLEKQESARSRQVVADERALGLRVCVRLAHRRLPPLAG